MLSVIVGPMFAGKSSELVRRVRRAKVAGLHVESFRPKGDTRSHGIQTHDGELITAKMIDSTDEVRLLSPYHTDLIVVDELQFLSGDALVLWKMSRFLDVVVAGLDTDFQNEPFPIMAEALSRADEVIKFTSVCHKCKGQGGRHTQRLDPGSRKEIITGPKLVPGGLESYESRCSSCAVIPR